MAIHNKTWALFLGAAATALASACGGDPNEVAGDELVTDEAAIFGSDACKNIDINITNSYEDGTTPRAIRVLKVDFWSASEGRWLAEDVPNTTIAYGASAWIMNQDLQYAENDLITQVRPRFNYREADGDWSDETIQVVNTPDVTCREDQDFVFAID